MRLGELEKGGLYWVMAQRHDRQKALESALRIFWEKGFHGTSLKDLEQGLGMHPGSIYAAFGSKSGLYCAALTHYADHFLTELQHQLDKSENALVVLASLVENHHPVAVNSGALAGCFLNKSIMESGIDSPDIKATQQTLMEQAEQRFAGVFELAQRQGHLSQQADCTSLARDVQAALAGIAVFSVRDERKSVAAEMIARLAVRIRGLSENQRAEMSLL